MKLPWYVALDRWIRRNPRLCSTLQGIVTLAVTLWMVGRFDSDTPDWLGVGAIFWMVALMYYTMLLARQVLEHFADEWREGD